MADAKQTIGTTALVLGAVLAGAVGHSQIAPAIPTSAHVDKLWISRTGAIGMHVAFAAGAAEGSAIVNCDADGSAPLINSAPNPAAADLCAAAAVYERAAIVAAPKLADLLAALPPPTTPRGPKPPAPKIPVPPSR